MKLGTTNPYARNAGWQVFFVGLGSFVATALLSGLYFYAT